MSEDKFQAEKIKASASGGPIDKFDLKLSKFNIQKAFNKKYGDKLEESSQESADEKDELSKIHKTLREIGGGSVQLKY